MKIDPKKTVFIIDGSSFLYRAYYGMRPLHSPSGEPVHAVYSFCRMIKKLMDTFKPEYLVLAWDSPGKTTRHEVYQEYKATRDAPPSDIFDQKDTILEFADAIGLRQIAQAGIEADDIMFSLAKERKKNGDNVVIVTSDKDMAQMLDEHTLIYDSFKEELMDEKKFEEKMGFPVARLPFYFSLLGDASDNIPGVRGIGKKGATALVQQFETLEDAYANLDKIEKKRARTALEANKDNAFLSRELFLLQYHKTGLSKKDCAFDAKNWRNARSLFEQLNFKSLLKGMGAGVDDAAEKIKQIEKYDFKCVITQEDLDALCATLKKHKVFAIDTETTGLRALQDKLVGLSFCVKEGEAFYVPCAHETGEQQLTCEQVLSTLKPILEGKKYKKYLHNAKFDRLVLHAAGIELDGVAFDSYIAASLTMKEWRRSSLKWLSEHYFGERMLNFNDVVVSKKYKDFSHVPLALATLYSAMDAHQTFRLYPILTKELAQENVAQLYEDIEFPVSDVLYTMQREGIYCDTKMLAALDERVSKELATIQEKILSEVGAEHETINLNSPKQVAQLLFEDLELPPQKKSAKGAYSTNNEVLQALSSMHPVPGMIIKYRELFKLKSTYIESLPTYVNPKTGRIHTSYWQGGVATGRLSSSDPNMQNIPASGTGLEIRAAFKPVEGNVYLSADYSQIELRVLAYLSRDDALVNAFLQKHDIHAETASRLFGVKLKDVTHEQRQVGKRINFSILYGLTPYGLSKDLGISFAEAKQYIETYFEQYPKVSTWMESVVAFTHEHGYVTTHWGRRRYIPAINETNKNLYEEARRVAINTVAQGTSAEIMKLGMIQLEQALRAQGYGAQILLQIHDELLLSVPKDELAKTEKLVTQVLENVVGWPIPLEVKTRSGIDWQEASK